MMYKNIVPAKFLSRPNRFVANVKINGVETAVHVKNTGRCRELLLPDSTVYLEDFSENPGLVPGRCHQKLGKLPLGNHGNFLELLMIQHQKFLQSGIDLSGPCGRDSSGAHYRRCDGLPGRAGAHHQVPRAVDR